MKTDKDFTPVMIKCPECYTAQAAIVENTIPFATYIHDCEFCGYTIMESERDEVKPFHITFSKSKTHPHHQVDMGGVATDTTFEKQD